MSALSRWCRTCGLAAPWLSGAVAQSYETPLDLQVDSHFLINVYSDAFKTDDQRLSLLLDTGSADMSVPAHCVQDNVEVVEAGAPDVWSNSCDLVKAKVWVLDFDGEPHAVEEYKFYRCSMGQGLPCAAPLIGKHSGIVGAQPGYIGRGGDLSLVSALAMEFGANYGHGIKAWRTGDDVQWSQLAASLLIGDPYDDMIWRDDAGSTPNSNSWNGKAVPGLSVTLYNSDWSPFAWHEGPANIDTGAPELQFVDEDLFNDGGRVAPCPCPGTPCPWAHGQANRHCVWDATAGFTFTGSDGTQLEWYVDLLEVSDPEHRSSEAIVCRDASDSSCKFAHWDPSFYHPGNSIFFNVQMVYYDAAMERVGIAPLGDQARRLRGAPVHA